MKSIFRIEQFDEKEDAIERLDYLKKMAPFMKYNKLPDTPKYHDGLFWIIYEEEL